MRNLLKIFVAGAMILAGAFVSNAQPGGGFGGQMDPEQIAKFRADDMKQTVKLTDDQYKKVVDLYKAQMEDMQKMFSSGQMPQMDQMQKQREEQEKKLKAILTDDQYTAWTKHEQERMQQMMNGGGFGGPGGPGGRPGGPGPR